MATISTTLELNDKMSSVLISITQNLNSLITATTKADAIFSDFGNSIGDVSKSVSSLASAGSPVDGWSDDISQADSDLQDLNHSVGDVNETAQESSGGNPFQSWQGGIVVANQALEITAKLMSTINSLASIPIQIFQDNLRASNQIQAVLRQQSNSLDELNQKYAMINQRSVEIEQSTGLAGGNLIESTAIMGRYVQDADALALSMKTVADFSVAMTGNIEDANASLSNYAQAIGRAMDGNTRYLERMGASFTDAQKEILKYGTEIERALVVSDVVNESWYGFADLMGQTAEGTVAIWNRNMENAQSMIGDFFTHIHATFISFLASFGVNLEAMVYWAVNLITSNIEVIIGALLALGAVATGVAIKFAIKWAIALWPITAIIGVLIALIGVLKWVGVTSEQVIIFMTALWYFFRDMFINVVIHMANIWKLWTVSLINAWEIAIVSFQNLWGRTMIFFKNVNDDALGVIQRAWFDTLTGVLRLYNATIGNIAGMVGLDWKVDIDARTSARPEARYTWEDRVPELRSYDFLSYNNPFDSISEGRKAGQEISDNFANAISNIQGFEFGTAGVDYSGSFGYGGFSADDLMGLGGLGDFATSSSSGGSALKVHQDAPLDISQDNLRMLLGIRKQDIKVEYRQLTPQVTMQFGDVRETVDYEAFANQFADKMQEVAQNDLERIT